jgi:hypothetical protein
VAACCSSVKMIQLKTHKKHTRCLMQASLSTQDNTLKMTSTIRQLIGDRPVTPPHFSTYPTPSNMRPVSRHSQIASRLQTAAAFYEWLTALKSRYALVTVFTDEGSDFYNLNYTPLKITFRPYSSPPCLSKHLSPRIRRESHM